MVDYKDLLSKLFVIKILICMRKYCVKKSEGGVRPQAEEVRSLNVHAVPSNTLL